MPFTEKISLALRISRSRTIMRRYFITNGFDGVLTMLGLLIGFRLSGSTEYAVLSATGFGAAVALMVSGLSSAYISESAERRHELDTLRQAMMDDLGGSAHEEASRIVPIMVALVNGLSPLLFALLILLPLWLGVAGFTVILNPVDLSIVTALVLVFMLGVYIGRLNGVFWLWAGLRAALLACVIALLLYLFE
jgi:predicted membrane protein (TIGR00267 family)